MPMATSFLQVNFLSGKKILLTENLIGFKPVPSRGLDLSKLPKVVTTPDLLSVVEAIEDSISFAVANDELDVLKRVFDSVLRGAEAWASTLRLSACGCRASAAFQSQRLNSGLSLSRISLWGRGLPALALLAPAPGWGEPRSSAAPAGRSSPPFGLPQK